MLNLNTHIYIYIFMNCDAIQLVNIVRDPSVINSSKVRTCMIAA